MKRRPVPQETTLRGAEGERGYATVATAGIIACLTALALIVAGVVSHVAARHEAQVAADLAAVAGAFEQVTGGDGCAEARHVAELNAATLTACREEGQDLVVTASVRAGAVGNVEASARAGPV